MSEKRSCKNCAYFRPLENLELHYHGTCHQIEPKYLSTHSGVYSWPGTFKDGFCGKWESKKEEMSFNDSTWYCPNCAHKTRFKAKKGIYELLCRECGCHFDLAWLK